MSLPTPNFVLNEQVTIGYGHSSVVLDAGTFVRPIDPVYVPKHIKEANPWFREEKEAYCYTPKGIQIIPLSSIRKL